jgi:RNA polymerase-binding protein DksA
VSISHNKLISKLKEEKEHLTKALEQVRAGAAKTSDAREGSLFGKKEEEATETTEFERVLALEKRLKSLLKEVEHALVKFEQGTYGLCDVCSQPIPAERLEALPQANICLRCKAQEAQLAKTKFLPK